jgi:DHA1 family multidrug resistance protein-like MFS transporter
MLIAVTFLGSLAWSFVFVALPFQVERLSTSGPAGTLAWTGWILGVASLGAVATGPLWARYGERTDPKAVCVIVQTLQGLGFVATAMARSVLQLLFARLVLGAVGSFSTLAFVIAGRESNATVMRRRLGAIQTALVIGTLVGPLPGAVAAARLGFRLTYLIGALILVLSASLLQWGMPSPPPISREAAERRKMPAHTMAVVATLVLVSSSQETFMAAILPSVLPGLGVSLDDVVEAGGLLIFVAGVAAAIGGLVAPILAEQFPERRLLMGLLVASSAVLVVLGSTRSFWAFTVLRGIQCLAIAPFFPLVVAQVARRADAHAIGMINAARVGSGFVGPLVATTVLATGSPGLVYFLLGGAGLAAALLLRRG